MKNVTKNVFWKTLFMSAVIALIGGLSIQNANAGSLSSCADGDNDLGSEPDDPADVVSRPPPPGPPCPAKLVARVVLAVVAWVEVRGVAPVAVQVVLEAEVVQLAGVEVPEEVEVLLVRLVPPAGCPLGR